MKVGLKTHFFVVGHIRLQEITQKTEKLILPILSVQGFDLVELEIKGRAGSQTVKVFIDTAGGVNLEQCAAVSRSISEVLDTEDLIPGRYRLEVSSPGLSRPLSSLADFRRNLKRSIKLTYADEQGTQEVWGIIANVTEEEVSVAGKQETWAIPFSRIRQCYIDLPW